MLSPIGPATVFVSVLATLPTMISSSAVLTPYAAAQPDWILHNITVWTAAAGPGADYITFIFQDTRKDFTLTTNCQRIILPKDGGRISDRTTYPCANDTVGFEFLNGKFSLIRTYIDPSVGPPGDDRVTARGAKNASLTTTKESCGVQQTLKTLNVEITSFAAK